MQWLGDRFKKTDAEHVKKILGNDRYKEIVKTTQEYCSKCVKIEKMRDVFLEALD